MQPPMTEILMADPDGIARAAELLRAGALVSFGTETVYGLGGDATNALAVAGIFAAKNRPSFNPLISHYPSAEAAFTDVLADRRAHLVAQRFWPGPLTLVLPRSPSSKVAMLTGAGLDSLAVRVPSNPSAHALLQQVGRPVAAPSANRSGRVSPTTAAHVLEELDGRIAAVLDSGPCQVGIESTVLDLSTASPTLLRPGGVALEDLEAVLGPIQIATAHASADHAPRSPGMLTSHYAPTHAVRLNADAVSATEGLLAFGPALPGAASAFQLSAGEDTTEAAARLFEGLRRLDAIAGLTGIAVMRIPDTGLGRAINDRLRRAAAPR